MIEENVTIEGESMMEEKVTIEGESTRKEKATTERGTPMENEMKKGGLEDTNQKAGEEWTPPSPPSQSLPTTPTYLWEAERGTMWRCFVNSIR